MMALALVTAARGTVGGGSAQECWGGGVEWSGGGGGRRWNIVFEGHCTRSAVLHDFVVAGGGGGGGRCRAGA